MATFNVVTVNDENNNNFFLSLREAIIQANSNGEADTINLPAGTYTKALVIINNLFAKKRSQTYLQKSDRNSSKIDKLRRSQSIISRQEQNIAL